MAEKLFAGNVKSQKSLHYIKVESGVGTASKVSRRSTSRTDDGEGVIKDDSGKKQRFHTDLKTGFGIVAARAHFPLSPLPPPFYHDSPMCCPAAHAPPPHDGCGHSVPSSIFKSVSKKCKGEQCYGIF